MPIIPLFFCGLMMLASMFPAWGHTSHGGFDYDPWCCNGGDCAELPDDAVVAGPDGWIVTLKKGEHPMVHSPQVRHVIPYKTARPSGDGKFHLCLWPNENNARCFYNPPSGF